jgi:hypothetical protein
MVSAPTAPLELPIKTKSQSIRGTNLLQFGVAPGFAFAIPCGEGATVDDVMAVMAKTEDASSDRVLGVFGFLHW